MTAQSQSHLLTPQEYLEWEAQQPNKYAYVDGEVYAMTGGTIPHNDITLNIASALKNHLRGKGCKVQMADAKVGVSTNGPFHYPDVMVSCDSRDREARDIIYHPCLIVEVLSPSTEAFDRGKKFKHYRRIDGLKEYVLIDSEKINVECYRLNEKNKWELTPYSLEEAVHVQQTESTVEFVSVSFQCSISLLYEDVIFPEQTDKGQSSLP